MNEGNISDIDIKKLNENASMKRNHNNFLTGGNSNERNSIM
ncbi:MAG: hypothetical protein VB128_04460 [Sedimentibacter saalensis]|jgi:hypothetical protein|nr:hypothetical protein [Sedimentibacter saalensis]MEA5094191.1 hypothetical protein [Sedimentibacter saalensis]